MAAHVHTQIRAAVATALAGLATTGSNVFSNRLYPMESTALPGLRVFTDNESVEAETVHTPHVQARSLDLVVECCAQANADLDTTCDQMAKEVETAMAAGITVGGKTLECVLTASVYDDQPAGTPAGVKRLTFQVQFYTLNNAPDALI